MDVATLCFTEFSLFQLGYTGFFLWVSLSSVVERGQVAMSMCAQRPVLIKRQLSIFFSSLTTNDNATCE